MRKVILGLAAALLVINFGATAVVLGMLLSTAELVGGFEAACETQAARLVREENDPTLEQLHLVTSDEKVLQYMTSEEFRTMRYMFLKDTCASFKSWREW